MVLEPSVENEAQASEAGKNVRVVIAIATKW